VADESSTFEKTDVLDLIISFLMEHEKKMDRTVQRLEKLLGVLAKGNHNPGSTQQNITSRQNNSVTVTINDPSGQRKIKSLTIEWETSGDARPSHTVNYDFNLHGATPVSEVEEQNPEKID